MSGVAVDKSQSKQDSCARCGKGELRLVAGRVTKVEPPCQANVFQCAACGYLDWRDIPHQPAGKRT